MTKILVSFLIFIGLNQHVLSQVMLIADTSIVNANEQFSYAVKITNSVPFTGAQFDVTFPNTLLYQEGTAALTSRAVGHILSTSLISAGHLRFIIYSTELRAFLGSGGSILNFGLSSKTLPGNYTIGIENAIISDSANHNILTNTVNGLVVVQSPEIVLSTDSIAFPDVPLLGYTDIPITINNTGNLSLGISSLSFNNKNFHLLDSSAVSIGAGNNVTRIIRFAPSMKGNKQGILTILSNDPDEGSISVAVHGRAYAVNELRIGNSSGRSGFQTTIPVSVNNMESFSAIQWKIALPSFAKYVMNSARLKNRYVDHIITADTTNNVLHVLAYSITNKIFSGTNGEIIEFNVLLQGTAGSAELRPTEIVISDTVGANIYSGYYSGNVSIASPNISLSPTSLDFGFVSISDTAKRSITIWNTGNDTLLITSMTSDNSAFSISSPLPWKILPGNFSTTTLKFHSVILDSNAGQLRIQSNDFIHSPLFVNVNAFVYRPNELEVDSIVGDNNEYKVIDVSLNNVDTIVAVQFDIAIPNNFTVFVDSAKITGRAHDHSISFSRLNDSTYRYLIYSIAQNSILGSTGILFTLPIRIGGQKGHYSLSLKNVILSDRAGKNVLSITKRNLPVIGDVKVLPVEIDVLHSSNPEGFSLQQNYPNPFNPLTIIGYSVSVRSHIVLSVYNTLGQKVAELVNGEKESGNYKIEFDAGGFSSGVYLCVMRAGDFMLTRKLVLMK